MKKYFNRREFAKISGLTILTAACGGVAYASSGAELPMAVEGEGQAKGIGYMEKAKDPAKACSKCSFYKAKLSKDATQKAPCQLLQNKYNVLPTGSCVAFAPKG